MTDPTEEQEAKDAAFDALARADGEGALKALREDLHNAGCRGDMLGQKRREGVKKPFGKLMLEIRQHSADNKSITMGELADLTGESVDRVMDAIEADKILSGKPAYIDSTGYVYVDPE